MPKFNPKPSEVKVFVPQYVVYILVSFDSYKLYVGQTHYLKRRMTQHYNGECYSSRILGNVKFLVCVRVWKVKSRIQALRLEKILQRKVRLGLVTYNNIFDFNL